MQDHLLSVKQAYRNIYEEKDQYVQVKVTDEHLSYSVQEGFIHFPKGAELFVIDNGSSFEIEIFGRRLGISYDDVEVYDENKSV